MTHRQVLFTALFGSFAMMPACSRVADYRDHCDKCSEEYSEDGCKALARAERARAKALKCGKEFRVYAKCLGEAPCLESGETASTCLMEEDEYSECTCKAELGDPTTCKWL